MSANAESSKDETETRNSLLTELRVRVDDFSALYSDMGKTASSIASLRTNLCEKLMLLNGASLTLVFTVIGLISGRLHETHQKIGTHSFELACCLLIVSTAFCIVHNQMITAMVIHEFNARFTLLLLHKAERFNEIVQKLGMDRIDPATSDWPKPVGRHTKYLLITERLARMCSACAQVSTLTAYVFLLSFSFTSSNCY